MSHCFCRWTYEGLNHLNKNCIYPFCIGSKTSFFAQPNDNGANAKFHAEFGKQKKAWRIAHPYSDFDRAAYNECLRRAVGVFNL